MTSEIYIAAFIAISPSINEIVKTACLAIRLRLIRPYHQAHSQMRLVGFSASLCFENASIYRLA